MKTTASFLLVSLIFFPTFCAARTPFPGTLIFRNGTLTASIGAVPLSAVMEELSRVSGARVVWLNGVASDERISIEFAELPFAAGLRRILAQKNFMVFYPAVTGARRPAQIWITSQGGGHPVLTVPPAASLKASVPKEQKQAEAEDDLAAAPLDRLTQIAMQDQDPAVREQVVTYLEVHARTDQRALSTLTYLVQSDPNPQVQNAAAEVLQGLE